VKWKRTEGHKMQGRAVSDAGYRMMWASNSIGTLYNAYTPEPNSRVLSVGYDKAQVLAACDRHAQVWSKTS
jgi:hypothetical protein